MREQHKKINTLYKLVNERHNDKQSTNAMRCSDLAYFFLEEMLEDGDDELYFALKNDKKLRKKFMSCMTHIGCLTVR